MVQVVHVRRRPGAPAVKPKEQPAPHRPMSRAEITAAIAEIKHNARRIRPPMNHQPNAFHEDKSELVRSIERLEDAVRKNEPLKAD